MQAFFLCKRFKEYKNCLEEVGRGGEGWGRGGEGWGWGDNCTDHNEKHVVSARDLPKCCKTMEFAFFVDMI